MNPETAMRVLDFAETLILLAAIWMLSYAVMSVVVDEFVVKPLRKETDELFARMDRLIEKMNEANR